MYFQPDKYELYIALCILGEKIGIYNQQGFMYMLLLIFWLKNQVFITNQAFLPHIFIGPHIFG